MTMNVIEAFENTVAIGTAISRSHDDLAQAVGQIATLEADVYEAIGRIGEVADWLEQFVGVLSANGMRANTELATLASVREAAEALGAVQAAHVDAQEHLLVITTAMIEATNQIETAAGALSALANDA